VAVGDLKASVAEVADLEVGGGALLGDDVGHDLGAGGVDEAEADLRAVAKVGGVDDVDLLQRHL
jgi:hypothetical protein